jgi:hypothetical protein
MMSQACSLDLRNKKFVQNSGGESLGRSRGRWEDNINIRLKETGEDGRWM